MELWLVRHATTAAILEGRIQGTLEYPLNEVGIKEAHSLAHRLRNQSFSFFFSSNLLRARQTSDIIASVRKEPLPLYSALLQEYNWGVIQGLTKKEMEEQYPYLLSQLQRDFYHTVIPGAEGLKKLFGRVKTFYHLLFSLEQKGRLARPVLIVSHGRFLQAFVIYFLKYDAKESWPFSLRAASLTILEGDFMARRRLRLFNDTCHLKHV